MAERWIAGTLEQLAFCVGFSVDLFLLILDVVTA